MKKITFELLAPLPPPQQRTLSNIPMRLLVAVGGVDAVKMVSDARPGRHVAAPPARVDLRCAQAGAHLFPDRSRIEADVRWRHTLKPFGSLEYRPPPSDDQMPSPPTGGRFLAPKRAESESQK